MANFDSIGVYGVWLRGSRKNIYRSIRCDDNGNYFIYYYGELIEVTRNGNTSEFVTVEYY